MQKMINGCNFSRIEIPFISPIHLLFSGISLKRKQQSHSNKLNPSHLTFYLHYFLASYLFIDVGLLLFYYLNTCRSFLKN